MSIIEEDGKKYRVSDPFRVVKSFIAGATGGVGLVAAGHPFDTIKVKLQTATGQASLMDAVKRTWRERGALGFYAGALSPLIGLSAMNSVLFTSYTSIARIFDKKSPAGDLSQLSFPQVIACAAFGGTMCSFVEGPQDLIKCKVQAGKIDAQGSYSALRLILRENGLRGLFQAHTATIIRNIPANIAYFGAYEYMKRVFGGGDSRKATKMQVFVSGGIAGISYWLFTYPLDMLKSVLQTEPLNPAMRQYSGYWNAASTIIKTEGVASLFKGFVPCMLRSFPANAACFFMFETCMTMLRNVAVKKERVY